jgi:4-hydroxy-3-methylbut-2-en-1-yl diphosphate synthase IspG/GcpE
VDFFRLAQKLKNPIQVQKFLDTFNYNKKETMYSARTAVHKRSAHCMEGAFVAAAICEQMGYPTLVLSMESQDGLDHVIFVYKKIISGDLLQLRETEV